MVKTPVLIITYTRIETAREVWNMIKKAKPEKLYFYSNRAPEDNPELIRRNNEIRSWIREVDWSCNLHTFFRDKQIDVFSSARSAIDWLFSIEERGIIFEDDCVPSIALFDFHDKMLEKYKDEKKIWYIGSTNYYEDFNPNGFDYIFTRTLGATYGWSTWRDRWQKLDWHPNINLMVREGLFRKYYFDSTRIGNCALRRFRSASALIIANPCWDFIQDLTLVKNCGLLIIPSRNLLTNIGAIGENTQKVNSSHFRKRYEGCTYVINSEPSLIQEDVIYDRHYYKHLFPLKDDIKYALFFPIKLIIKILVILKKNCKK